MIGLKQVVVATDFGEAAQAALDYGREFARTFGAKLVLLHVVDNVLMRPYAAEGYVATYPELQREIESAAQKQLDATLDEDDRRTLNAEAIVLKSNNPAAAIVNYARDTDVDIVIMGTHGRGAVAHMLMGSVAERVVRTAPCPVLTVRHPEHEFIRPDALVAVARA
jgi:nucleotide-binding universal stress UspA family protein